MFLHCSYPRHVSALAMSHLQVDHFLLRKENHTVSKLLYYSLRISTSINTQHSYIENNFPYFDTPTPPTLSVIVIPCIFIFYM